MQKALPCKPITDIEEFRRHIGISKKKMVQICLTINGWNKRKFPTSNSINQEIRRLGMIRDLLKYLESAHLKK